MVDSVYAVHLEKGNFLSWCSIYCNVVVIIFAIVYMYMFLLTMVGFQCELHLNWLYRMQRSIYWIILQLSWLTIVLTPIYSLVLAVEGKRFAYAKYGIMNVSIYAAVVMCVCPTCKAGRYTYI